MQTLREPLLAPSLAGPSHFWRCCYGNHPRSLVLAEHSGVHLGDLRVSELSVAPHLTCSPSQSHRLSLSPLLTCPSEWLPSQSLVSAISPSPHPHQFHVTTSHSLLLLDARQPRWPLLEQSHDLSHAPQILVATQPLSLPSEQLVMVTDGVVGENQVFSIATPTGTPPFVSSPAHVIARYRYSWNFPTFLIV